MIRALELSRYFNAVDVIMMMTSVIFLNRAYNVKKYYYDNELLFVSCIQ